MQLPHRSFLLYFLALLFIFLFHLLFHILPYVFPFLNLRFSFHHLFFLPFSSSLIFICLSFCPQEVLGDVLAKALSAVARERPDDPVQFVADYLYRARLAEKDPNKYDEEEREMRERRERRQEEVEKRRQENERRKNRGGSSSGSGSSSSTDANGGIR